MPKLRLMRRQGAVDQVRYRKAEDGGAYYHDTDAPTDLLLGELGPARQKVAVLVPRDRADGWERTGGTTWLSNPHRPPRRPMKKRAHTKRRPPKGFRTWSAYMASIRPNGTKKRRRSRSSSRSISSGGSMARKKRKSPRRARRSTRARTRSVVVYARPNKPRRRHHARYRRNGPGGVVGIATNLAIGGLVGGATMVAAEGAARLVRGRIFKKPSGTLLGAAIETGTGLAAGIGIEMAFGRGRYGTWAKQIAHDAVAGVAASQLRTALKQMNVPIITEALSDAGTRIIRLENRRPVNGYIRPGTRAVNGYIAPRAALSDEDRTMRELGYR